MAEGPSVVVVASTMVDMICYLDRAPVAGETVAGNDFVLGFGGKGANQAVMASRLGCSVELAACLGDDVFADMAIEHYRREGLGLQHVRRIAQVTSGVAPIWVDATGENRIVIVPGANSHLSPAHAVDAVTGAGHVDVVLSQMEVPQDSTRAAFDAARRRGAVTILNPAPAHPPVEGLLDLCDWVIVNETEFADLFPGHPADGAGPRDEDLVAAGSTLRGRLVVTLGAAGAAVVDGSQVQRVPAPAVSDVVDTTGAGDAFVGAFTYMIGAGHSATQAAQVACACAAVSVTRRGTQSSFLDKAEAVRLVDRHCRP
jgi:ribokinase